ncbi:hypothetical protein DRO97_05785 [Archaeoglobales archaeon]|nr:MAG: hypothetical protein DRO97_05785 [Archaeoglobales archaeon]
MKIEKLRKIIEKNPELVNLKIKGVKKSYNFSVDRLDAIIYEFVEWVRDKNVWEKNVFEEAFKLGKEIALEYFLTINEIERISESLSGIAGFFIAGMCRIMNNDDIAYFRVKKGISGLGYKHKHGKIVVEGSRLLYLGMYMEGGEIVVRGNVTNYLGRGMKGGKIIVEGNARNWVGYEMKGGKIVIKGSAGDVIGRKMEGGEIVIDGNAGSWIGDDATGGIIRVLHSFSSY